MKQIHVKYMLAGIVLLVAMSGQTTAARFPHSPMPDYTIHPDTIQAAQKAGIVPNELAAGPLIVKVSNNELANGTETALNTLASTSVYSGSKSYNTSDNIQQTINDLTDKQSQINLSSPQGIVAHSILSDHIDQLKKINNAHTAHTEALNAVSNAQSQLGQMKWYERYITKRGVASQHAQTIKANLNKAANKIKEANGLVSNRKAKVQQLQTDHSNFQQKLKEAEQAKLAVQ